LIRKNTIKERLKNGENVIGTFVKSTDVTTVEILGLCGYDFIVVDNEHTIMNKETLTNILRVCDSTDMMSMVRIREVNEAQVRQALDTGAMGIMVPMTSTKEEVENVVKYSKYAPEGVRGYSASHRAAAYGFMNATEYAEISNRETMVACYCETKGAVDNIDEILAVPGLDIIFIGPFDLSQALGVTGNPGHKIVQDAIDMVTKKARAAGKAVGTIAADPASAKALFDRGIQYVCMSSDINMIAQLGQQYMKEFKG